MSINIIDLNTGKVREESQREMVLNAFRNLGEGTDWEALDKIEELYHIKINERNWVSARRGDLITEGLIEDTGIRKKGDFGKSCTIWRFNPTGKKHDPTHLTDNEMKRTVKYLNDKCRIANSFQKNQMIKVIEHYKQLSGDINELN